MEWQFKPQARLSTVTGKEFNEGDKITCYLYMDDEGHIMRADVLDSDSKDFEIPKNQMGRWSRVVKDKKDEEKEAMQQTLATSEEIFLSLFAEGTVSSEKKDTLKHLLALMLQRKRVLRSSSKAINGVQRYVYVKTKEVFDVPVKNLTPEDIQEIEQDLESIIA
jgi:hypothetical protein